MLGISPSLSTKMRQTKTEQRINEIRVELKKKLNFDYSPIILRLIRKDALTLRRLFECSCNGCTREKLPSETWKQYDQARELQQAWIEKRIESVLKRLDRRLREYNIPYYIQSDPRGCSLYLATTSDNSYNTEGVAIY